MEGRGVKTYFEILLRSFQAERSGLLAGFAPQPRRGDGGCWVQHPWGPVQLPGWVTWVAFPGDPVQARCFGSEWF